MRNLRARGSEGVSEWVCECARAARVSVTVGVSGKGACKNSERRRRAAVRGCSTRASLAKDIIRRDLARKRLGASAIPTPVSQSRKS